MNDMVVVHSVPPHRGHGRSGRRFGLDSETSLGGIEPLHQQDFCSFRSSRFSLAGRPKITCHAMGSPIAHRPAGFRLNIPVRRPCGDRAAGPLAEAITNQFRPDRVIQTQEGLVSRRKGSVRLAAAACRAVLISLSFSGSAQSSTPRPSGSLVSTALAAWSGFPVQASTRPLVLIDGDDVNAPILGFPNDNTKLAYEDGAIVAPSKYPTAPSFAAGFTLESPQAAFKTLKSVRDIGTPATTSLVVTAVTLGRAIPVPDRGQRTLPAWLFSFQNVQNPAQVLAVSPRASSRRQKALSQMQSQRVPRRSERDTGDEPPNNHGRGCGSARGNRAV